MDKFTYNCDTCGRTLTGLDGVIAVNTAEAYRLTRQAKARENPLAPLDLSQPVAEPAHWRALCDACNPGEGYWFGAYEADTPGELLDWTLHLMSKEWFEYTDWAEFIKRHGTWSNTDPDDEGVFSDGAARFI